MPWPTDNDTELFAAIDREVERQNTGIQLIASENFTSPAVMRAVGSVLTNKYSEGYPGKRYYGGNEFVDEVEDLARERVKSLFGAEAANVQPHSGANANVAVYLALLQAGDTVLGLSLDHGGHLTHGSPVNLSGRFYNFVSYRAHSQRRTPRPGSDRVTWPWMHRPKMIVAGADGVPADHRPGAARARSADEVGALFLFDAAHIAGLDRRRCCIPTRSRSPTWSPSRPTRRSAGPAAAASCRPPSTRQAIDKAIFPGLQGGPLEHVIAGKAVAFREAADPAFADYARQIVANSQALAAGLAANGFRLVSGGTDNHLMLVDLQAFDSGLTGKDAQVALDAAGITCNKNTVPDDPRSPFVTSGLRLGTPSVTTQGMREAEMGTIAELITRVLRAPGDEAVISAVRSEVRELCSDFVPYPS
ncbi:MAG: serine hydroxymethyltransferase [Microthrixaceae bacterium]